MLSPARSLTTRRFVRPDSLARRALVTCPMRTGHLSVVTGFVAPTRIDFRGIHAARLATVLVRLITDRHKITTLPS